MRKGVRNNFLAWSEVSLETVKNLPDTFFLD